MTPTDSVPARRSRIALAAATTIVAGAIVHAGTLRLFFAQDDWAGLARASGFLPRLEGPWRLLSHQLFWDAMRPLAGLDPVPYHLASLVSHLAASVLLAVLLARRVSAFATLAGAVFFATHPALFTGVHWISAIGDSWALGFALIAALAFESRGAVRWMAVPAFALALLAKEAALPLPLALLLFPPEPGTPLRARLADRVWLAVALAGLAYFAWYANTDAMGSRAVAGEIRPYALTGGADVWRNALTYLGWAANPWLPTVRAFADAQDPAVWPWGAGLLALWLAGTRVRPLVARGWLAWGGWFAAFVLVLLPLGHHTCHYYLTVPLAGVSGLIAAALDAALPARARRPSPAAVAAVALAALFTMNGAAMTRRIATRPFLIEGLYADPIVDRAAIARRATAGLAAANLPPRTALAIWPLPPTSGGAGAAAYAAENLRRALLDGLAVRIMIPAVSDVRFTAGYERLAPTALWALVRPNGAVRVTTPATLDSLIRRFGPPR